MVAAYYFLMVDPNNDPDPFLVEATRLNNMNHNHFSTYGVDGDMLPAKINHVARGILYNDYLRNGNLF